MQPKRRSSERVSWCQSVEVSKMRVSLSSPSSGADSDISATMEVSR